MFIRYFQKGFNFSQDGPGNRLVYHLQGCNLRCPWCSNPEGMDFARPAREETPEAVAKAVLSGRPMFFDGGGLTLTGGECTAQLDRVYCRKRRSRRCAACARAWANASSARCARRFPRERSVPL